MGQGTACAAAVVDRKQTFAKLLASVHCHEPGRGEESRIRVRESWSLGHNVRVR